MDYEALISLAERMAQHTGRSEATLSDKAAGQARLFATLRAGGGCTVRTFQRVVFWFDENWPADLEWPSEISRPSNRKGHAA